MMNLETLESALAELGSLASAEGKVIDLAIYGGSALMLASNFRVATEDIDAVALDDQEIVNRLALGIANRRRWSPDWINDGVRTYLSPNVDGVAQHHELFRAYPSGPSPGLRVFVPTAEYILAMKLMAMRIDDAGGKSDFPDIVNLLAVVGLTGPQDTLDFLGGFYPEARVSGRVLLGLREIWRGKASIEQELAINAPQYLGRGGPTQK